MTTIDRRTFLAGVSSAAAASLLPWDARGAVQASAGTRNGSIIVNALGGLGDPNLGSNALVPELTPRVLAEAHASGLTAVNITLGYVSGPDDPFEASVRDIAATDALVRKHAGDVLQDPHRRRHRRAKAEQQDRRDLRFPERRDDGQGRRAASTSSRTWAYASFQLTYNPANQLGDGSMAPGKPRAHAIRPRGGRAAQREPRDGRSFAQRRADLPRRGARLDGSRSRSITPAAARSPICRATRPTRNCAWSPRRAASSASTSCRSSTPRATPTPTTWSRISIMR